MHDSTDLKIWIASLIEPSVYKAVKAALAANQPQKQLTSIYTDEALTPEETAQLLKVSKVTVWDWTKRGILKKHTIGNQVRYMRSEVMAALTKKSVTA